MKNYLLLYVLGCIPIVTLAQHKKINSIAISLPIVFNQSEAIFYRFDGRKRLIGNGVSYGINVNYSKSIYKNFFGIAGIGYYKQVFGIQRPFKYIPPDGSKPLISTTSYIYRNIHSFVGFGHKIKLSNNYFLNNFLSYHHYRTYSQNYKQDYFPNHNPTFKQSFNLGSNVMLSSGIEKQVSKNLSIGLDILLPIITNWNNDNKFIGKGYSSNEPQVAKNKFSVGTNFCFKYRF